MIIRDRGSVDRRLTRNIVAGWISSLASALIGLAVVPIYLRLLGTEAYGLIGFYVTLQSLLLVLDLGMTGTVNREVARCVERGELFRAARLVHALAWIFTGLAVVSGATIAGLAPLLSTRWLKVGSLDPAQVSTAIAISGALVALRWPIALYQSVLLGAQRLVLYSAINIAATVFGSLGSVAMLVFVTTDIRWFFGWQVIVALVQGLVFYFVARQTTGNTSRWRPEFGEVLRIWRFSVALGLVTAIGLCFMQMDKIILSRLVSLEEFGRYMLATTVAGGLYAVVMPVFNAMYPRFSALVAGGQAEELERLYRFSSHVLATLLLPLGVVVAVFASDLIGLWTGNAALAVEVAPTVGLLVLGSALHGVMFLPYALTLALGNVRLALYVNMALLAAIGPLILVLTLTYGGRGAAGGWLILHAFYLLLGSYATHRVLLPALRYRWLVEDVGPPLLLALLSGGAGFLFLRWGATGLWTSLFLAIMVFMGAVLCTALLSDRLRGLLASKYIEVCR